MGVVALICGEALSALLLDWRLVQVPSVLLPLIREGMNVLLDVILWRCLRHFGGFYRFLLGSTVWRVAEANLGSLRRWALCCSRSGDLRCQDPMVFSQAVRGRVAWRLVLLLLLDGCLRKRLLQD